MPIVVIIDVPIAAAHRTAPRAIGEHARGSLKDVAVDAFDRLALAPSGDADEDFLGEILGIVLQLRRAILEETVQRAAVAHRQCLKKRLPAPGNVRGDSASSPIACHSSLPTRESEPVRNRNQPCAVDGIARGMRDSQTAPFFTALRAPSVATFPNLRSQRRVNRPIERLWAPTASAFRGRCGGPLLRYRNL